MTDREIGKAVKHFLELKNKSDNFKINELKEDIKKLKEAISCFKKIAGVVKLDNPQITLDNLHQAKKELEYSLKGHTTQKGEIKRVGRAYDDDLFLPIAYPVLEAYHTKANPLYQVTKNDILRLGIILIKRNNPKFSNKNALENLSMELEIDPEYFPKRTIYPLEAQCHFLKDKHFELILNKLELQTYCKPPSYGITL